jgi:hypothetical protein
MIGHKVAYELEFYRKDTGEFLTGLSDEAYLTDLEDPNKVFHYLSALIKRWLSQSYYCTYWDGDIRIEDELQDMYLSQHLDDTDPDFLHIYVVRTWSDREEYMQLNNRQNLAFVDITDLVKGDELEFVLRINRVKKYRYPTLSGY